MPAIAPENMRHNIFLKRVLTILAEHSLVRDRGDMIPARERMALNVDSIPSPKVSGYPYLENERILRVRKNSVIREQTARRDRLHHGLCAVQGEYSLPNQGLPSTW